MSDGRVRLSDWTEDRLLSIDMNTDVLVARQPDLATRVAADLFTSRSDWRSWCEEEANATALKALRFGRIFAEAVNQATQPQNAAEKDKP